MATLEHIERDIERTQDKIADLQGKLKELSAQYTEVENLHIVAAVRALKMTRAELTAFIKDGTLPKGLQEQTVFPASRYSRRKPEVADEAATAETDTNQNTESEGNNNDDE